MKLWILLGGILSAFAFEPQEGVRGGDHVGNGGGLAENNVLLAYQNLGRYIDFCLNASACGLEADDREVLQKIKAALPQEYAVKNQMRILSDSALFGQPPRLALTGNNVGSAILINKDMIYQWTPGGQVRAVSLPTFVSLLVHEMGHHHGIIDHTYLDKLGSYVAAFMAKGLRDSRLGPAREHIFSRVINLNEDETYTSSAQLILSDSYIYIDATPYFEANVNCPQTSQGRFIRQGYRIWNERWRRLDSLQPYVEGLATATCQWRGGPGGTENLLYYFSYSFSAYPRFALKQNKLVLLSDFFQLQVTACRSSSDICNSSLPTNKR